jgi:hypothetical protein
MSNNPPKDSVVAYLKHISAVAKLSPDIAEVALEFIPIITTRYPTRMPSICEHGGALQMVIGDVDADKYSLLRLHLDSSKNVCALLANRAAIHDGEMYDTAFVYHVDGPMNRVQGNIINHLELLYGD